MTSGFCEFEGYRIPEHLVRSVGATPERFPAITREHLRILGSVVPLSADMDVLEIGCGIGGDAMLLAELLSPERRYLGIDVRAAYIDWCTSAISSRRPNFSFHRFDVKEEWYNRDGAVTLQDCRIPLEDDSIDLVILNSVFTHMVPADVAHYLGEFARCLRPKGCVYATFFVVDDAILARHKTRKGAWITFPHLVEDGFYVHDLAHPTQITGYTFEAIARLADKSGLAIDPVIRGSWSGAEPKPVGGQDNVIFRSLK